MGLASTSRVPRRVGLRVPRRAGLARVVLATLLLVGCAKQPPPEPVAVEPVAVVEEPEPEAVVVEEPPPPPAPTPTRAICAPWPDAWTPYEEVDLNGDGRLERFYLSPPRIEGSPKKMHIFAKTCAEGWIFVYAEVHHQVEILSTSTRGWKDLKSTISYESGGELVVRSWKYSYNGKTWARGAEL